MNSPLKALQQALNTSTQRSAPRRKLTVPRTPEASPPAKVEPEPQVEAVKPAASGSYMAPSREGKTNITAYLSPDYKSSLRLIQARTSKSLQTLIAESLNDLFVKYDVPTVRGD